MPLQGSAIGSHHSRTLTAASINNNKRKVLKFSSNFPQFCDHPTYKAQYIYFYTLKKFQIKKKNSNFYLALKKIQQMDNSINIFFQKM